jgi:hypothetical protein
LPDFSFVGGYSTGSIGGFARILACSATVLSFIYNFLKLLGNYDHICFGNLSACMVFLFFFNGLLGDGIVELTIQCEWALNVGMGFVVGDHLFLPVVKLIIVFNNVFKLAQDVVLVVLNHFIFLKLLLLLLHQLCAS